MAMNYQELINSNIKKLRLENHLTQEQFAEKVGLSLQGLSNIERNRYQPTSATIDKICKTFKITPMELLISKTNKNKNILNNIYTLLENCSTQKLNQIYDIISILIKKS